MISMCAVCLEYECYAFLRMTPMTALRVPDFLFTKRKKSVIFSLSKAVIFAFDQRQMAYRFTLSFLLSIMTTRGFADGSQCPAAGTPNRCVRGKATENVEASTATECCQRCAALPSGCAAWQFDHSLNNSVLLRPSCHLKPSAAHVVACNTSISGIVIPAPPGPSPGPGPGPAPLAFATVFTSSEDGKATPVLQMNAHVSIFGSAAKGETALEVYLDGVTVSRTSVNANPASPERAWIAVLPPQPPSSNLRTLTVGNGHFNATLTVRFGIVILCSGQSNMVWIEFRIPFYLPPFAHLFD